MKNLLVLLLPLMFIAMNITGVVNNNILSVHINDNNPPNPPEINGLSSGKIKTRYSYFSKCSKGKSGKTTI